VVWPVAWIAGLVLAAGCSRGPARVAAPALNPHAGRDALALYDANGEGKISGEELDKVPALRYALERLDTDGDGGVSAAEIDQRVQTWRESQLGLITVLFQVNLDGAPLEGARLRLDPEPFLGDKLKPAEGVTGPEGSAFVSLAKEDLPDPLLEGVAAGWYRIRITQETNGDPVVPERYKLQTTLGCEIALDADWIRDGVIVLELSSKDS